MVGGGHDHRSPSPFTHQSDLRFHLPQRQSAVMLAARPIAVSEMVHQIPALPHRAAANGTMGTRAAVNDDDAIIGGNVSPAPPSAPSSTISAQIPSCDSAAIRK